jgi:hypothetical protein
MRTRKPLNVLLVADNDEIQALALHLGEQSPLPAPARFDVDFVLVHGGLQFEEISPHDGTKV